MVYNQLFSSKPPMELVTKLLNAFGLKDINDRQEFCEIDADKYNTIIVIRGMDCEIKDCYIPCKQKVYINNPDDITYKSSITILRQFLKVYDYDLHSREKFIKGNKYIMYKVITKSDKQKFKNKNSNEPPKEIVISFD